jgi:hypothetical protein
VTVRVGVGKAQGPEGQIAQLAQAIIWRRLAVPNVSQQTTI